MVPAAQKDRSDSRLPEQKEPASEDQTYGAEETGAGRLHPGNMSSCLFNEVGPFQALTSRTEPLVSQPDIL